MKAGKDPTRSRKGAEEGARAFAALVSRRRHRVFLWVAGAVGLLSAASAGFLVWEVRAVQSNLAAAQVTTDRLQTEMARHRQPSAEVLGDIRKHTAAARSAAGTPVWSVAEYLPLMGPPLRSARGLSVAADEMATGVLPKTVRLHQLLASGQIVHQGRVDLRRLSAATDLLGNVHRRLTGIETSLNGLPGSTVVGRLDTERQRLSDRVARLSGSVSEAKATMRLLMPLLGASEPRSYFLAFQNNAEARGTGGLVGTFGILTADRGRITLHDFASDDTLPRTTTPVANFGPEFDRRYGAAESTQGLANSNLSAHFPYAAQIWAGLWQRHTGQRLDGAIATDPVGLARVLKATGPVRLPDGKHLTADNTVEFTESTLYASYSNTARKRFLVQVAQSVATALLGSHHDSAALLHALRQNADDGRLRVWSRDASTESALEEAELAGDVPERTGPFAYLVVNNSAGNKMDYYLRRSLTYELGRCEGGTRSSVVRIKLTNAAPATGLPALVALRSDDPLRSHLPGSTSIWLSLYASSGARFTSGTLDGRRLLLSSTEERGHPVLGTQVELLPGQTREVDIRLLEPASDRAPVVPLQPLAWPQTTKVSIQPCVK
ncbi:DUF4012 domain-containing protein [Streptomyces sp. ALI-76-A]|uniref:DUF4012 domain-containing protein n=1 Tax=Streptomyces sp. ALI-76-A TaxID=3025736 RepID=UPI00256F2D65|nr:DUF4012 domain-containing protein [Streptomyces sp. ALI-76-A]MDL5206296.1 DUF4012 domain-containing protein [Streptomyces sp. ALI-76-A]